MYECGLSLSQVFYCTVQLRCAGERDDSHARWDRAEWHKIHHAIQKGKQFKTYKSFISWISHLILLECGQLWINETVESETSNKCGLLYPHTQIHI